MKNKDNRRTLLGIMALVVCILGALAWALTPSQISANNGGNHVSAMYETDVVTQVKHNGVWLAPVDQGHNLVVNNGLNWTVAKIFGMTGPSGGGTATVIAVGNFTSAETATLTTINNTATNAPIPDCGLAPASGSTAWVGAENISISKVFTSSTCASEIVNTTALYNDTVMTGLGTTTIMFAGKNFSAPVTLVGTSGDQLNITWYVWVTSS